MSDNVNNFRLLYGVSDQTQYQPTERWCMSTEFKPDPILHRPRPEFKKDVVGQEGFEPPSVPK